MDVIEIDGASNRGIDEIRDLREKVRFAPTEGKHKVYIIDEVHMLTTDAFNALLKTLEEPPGHVVFVLATTEPHKVPATILSRCQRYDFRSLTAAEIGSRLEHVAAREGISVSEDALALIARHAAGGMRDALGLLDQCAAFADGEITEQDAADALGVVPSEEIERFAAAVAAGDTRACMKILQNTVFLGKDLRQFARDVSLLFRQALLDKVSVKDMADEHNRLLGHISTERLIKLLEQLGRLDIDIRMASDERVPFELAIVRMTAVEEPNPGAVSSVSVQLQTKLQEMAAEISELREQMRQIRAAGEAVGGQPTQPTERRGSDAAYDGDVVANSPVSTPVRKDEPLPEPAVRTQAEAQSSGSNGTELLAKIKSVWEELFEVLRQERQASLGAFLREAAPACVTTDGRLILAFPNDRGFHKASVEQPKMREHVERTVSRLVSEPLAVVCEFGSPEEVAQQYGAEAEKAPGSGNEEHTAAGITSDHSQQRDEASLERVTRPTGEVVADESPEQLETAPRPIEDEGGGAEVKDSSPDVENDPMIKAALEIFGGKVIRLD